MSWFSSFSKPSASKTSRPPPSTNAGHVAGAFTMAEEDQVRHHKPRYTVTVTETPKFDLQSYIPNYSGRTVFRRLYLIASCCIPLQEEAAKLALVVAKQGQDISAYNDAVELLGSVTTSKDTKDLVDREWLSNAEKKNAAESKRLENELKQYKNNLIRESIRMASEELGTHAHKTGDLPSALKSFTRMRDYCTTSSHIVSTAFRMIAVNIEQKNWLGVQSQITKIRSLQMKPEETAKNQPKIAAAQGIQHMNLGDYKDAATAFLSVDISLGDTYNDVISSNDVAVYGGLCALASMNRAELQTKVLDNSNFRSFLELEPHIRRAINYFCASKYSQCLDILESYRADYLLDIYLQDQLPTIYQRVRTKSIVQYFQPFSRVTLESMETMFGLPTTTSSTLTQTGSSRDSSEAFRNELIQMISSNALRARIDLENNVLIAYEESPRAAMQQQALDTADNFIREARLKLLRLNAVNGALEVKPLNKTSTKSGTGVDIGSLVDTASNGYGSSNLSSAAYSLRNAARG